MEFALKTSFLTSQKQPHHLFATSADDLWIGLQNGNINSHGVGVGVIGGVGGGDDFFVDDLLDFSNDDDVEGEGEEEEGFVNSGSSSVVEEQQNLDLNVDRELRFKSLNPELGFGNSQSDELSLPTEDVADMEWLSHFVEDSFSLPSFPAGTGMKIEPVEREPVLSYLRKSTVLNSIPVKARSKRSRRATSSSGNVWSTCLGFGQFTDMFSSELTTSSGVSSCSSSAISSSSCLIYGIGQGRSLQYLNYYGGPPPSAAKKPKIKTEKAERFDSVWEPAGLTHMSQQQPLRKCSHCGVQKTPQWRTGPMGAKTLCNACGVRYKSGRLLPEYRPACSPTFSTEVHSNNHRKVLEMRKKKETGYGCNEPGSGYRFIQPVQTFG